MDMHSQPLSLVYDGKRKNLSLVSLAINVFYNICRGIPSRQTSTLVKLKSIKMCLADGGQQLKGLFGCGSVYLRGFEPQKEIYQIFQLGMCYVHLYSCIALVIRNMLDTFTYMINVSLDLKPWLLLLEQKANFDFGKLVHFHGKDTENNLQQIILGL